MMPNLLLCLAFISFALAAVNVAHKHVNFVALGLALWAASLLF